MPLNIKGYYFIYKYQFDIKRNYFLSTNFLFIFIRNKTEFFNIFIEVIIYKFKILLYLEGILL